MRGREMKRKIATALLIPFTVTGCAGIQPKPKIKPVVPPKPNVNAGSKPVEVINSKLVVKSDSLNHSLNGIDRKELFVDWNGGTLKEFCTFLTRQGVFCEADDFLKFKKIGQIKGDFSLKTLLNAVASQVGGFWTNDGGVIKFVHEKFVVYTIPLLSKDASALLYGMSDGDDKVVSAFKDQVFKEIKDALDSLFALSYSKGTVKVSYDYKSEENSEKVASKEETGEKKKQKQALSEAEKEKTASSDRSENSSSSSAVTQKSESKIGNKLEASRRVVRRGKGGISPAPQVQPVNESVNSKVTSQAASKGKQEQADVQNKKKSARKDSYAFQKTDALKKQIAEQVKKAGNLTKEEKVELERVLDKGDRVAVLKSVGEIVARVNRQEEKMLDSVIREIVTNDLSNLVSLEVYVVEIDASKAKNISFSLESLRRAWRKEFTFNLENQQASLAFTSLSQNYVSGIASGVNLSAVVSYLVSKGNGEIVSSSTLLAVPRTLARIKSAVGIPYLEPQDVSVGGTSPTLSYKIKYINDGIELRIIPTVIGNSIFFSLGVYENQFLGDKTVQAGQLGTFTLPMQSPKEINTTVRCRPGDVIFIGGMKKYSFKVNKTTDFGVPESASREKNYKEVFILIKPKLIKFR
jgi:hypothetical protein